MPLLNDADVIYLGYKAVDAVYAGHDKVWPSSPLIMHAGPHAYARLDSGFVVGEHHQMKAGPHMYDRVDSHNAVG
jgi:hypothetical protein